MCSKVDDFKVCVNEVIKILIQTFAEALKLQREEDEEEKESDERMVKRNVPYKVGYRSSKESNRLRKSKVQSLIQKQRENANSRLRAHRLIIG